MFIEISNTSTHIKAGMRIIFSQKKKKKKGLKITETTYGNLGNQKNWICFFFKTENSHAWLKSVCKTYKKLMLLICMIRIRSQYFIKFSTYFFIEINLIWFDCLIYYWCYSITRSVKWETITGHSCKQTHHV